MESGAWLEIIDREGWTKRQPLDKKITFIGSDRQSEIHLAADRGGSIEPMHAQLIRHPGGYKLVNTSTRPIVLDAVGQELLAPQRTLALNDGDSFRLGEYTLVLRGRVAAPPTPLRDAGQSGAVTQRGLGLSLFLTTTRLAPERSIDGVVTVRNLGDRSGVKIELALEGLDPECYTLEPGPLLSSGAEQDVSLRLFHLGHNPPAGRLQITLRAAAPKAYPKEPPVAVSELIEVLPLYRHRLTLRDPEAVMPSNITLALPPPAPRPVPQTLIEAPFGPPREPGPAPLEWGQNEPAPTPLRASSPPVVTTEPKPAVVSPPAGPVEAPPGMPAVEPVKAAPAPTPPPPFQPAEPAKFPPRPRWGQIQAQRRDPFITGQRPAEHQSEVTEAGVRSDFRSDATPPVEVEERTEARPVRMQDRNVETRPDPDKAPAVDKPAAGPTQAGWGWEDERESRRRTQALQLKSRQPADSSPSDRSEREELVEEWWTEEDS